MVSVRFLQMGLLGSWLSGCGVEATSKDTGGVDDSGQPGCAAGVNVVLSDFGSTQLALADLEGQTQSSSFLSTASTQTKGLAFALSGDVVVPRARPASGQVVLIDRFGTNVLTWADPRSGTVNGQLPVGTGFESNPQDYVEVDAGRAFVSRWGQNGDSGREPFDRGGDLLVVDIEAHEVSDSIDLPMIDDLPPRPGGLTRLRDQVLVPLDPISADFATTGTAMLAGVSIDDQEMAWLLELAGLKSCGRVAVSPDASTLAVACSGALTPEGVVEGIDESAIVLFDALSLPPVERTRFSASDLFGVPLQNDVEYANDQLLLFKTQSALGGSEHNRWLALDLDSGEVEEILQAEPDSAGDGKGLVYGGMVCAPGCSNICLLADSDRSVLQRVRVRGGVELIESVQVERSVGLPPRVIGLR
jgi:hypothetical protein